MNSIEQIVHKNYLLANLCYSISPYPAVVRLVRDKHGDIVVAFQKDSARKSTIGPAKWLDKNGVAHAWKVEGHPEFESLVGKWSYLIIGNVMSPSFVYDKDCPPPSIKYLKEMLLEFKLRAYVFDMIMEKFNHGISFKRVKSFENNEQFAIVNNIELGLNTSCTYHKWEKPIVEQFKRLAA